MHETSHKTRLFLPVVLSTICFICHNIVYFHICEIIVKYRHDFSNPHKQISSSRKRLEITLPSIHIWVFLPGNFISNNLFYTPPRISCISHHVHKIHAKWWWDGNTIEILVSFVSQPRFSANYHPPTVSCGRCITSQKVKGHEGKLFSPTASTRLLLLLKDQPDCLLLWKWKYTHAQKNNRYSSRIDFDGEISMSCVLLIY